MISILLVPSVFSIAPSMIEACYSAKRTLLEIRYSTMANISDKKLATVNAISSLQWRTIDRYPGYILWQKKVPGKDSFSSVWFEDQVGQERGEGRTIIPMLDPSTVLRYSSEMVERSWRALEVVLRSTNRDYSVKKTVNISLVESSWKSGAPSLRIMRTILTFWSDPSPSPLYLRHSSQIITPDGVRSLIYLIPFLKISYRFRLQGLGEMRYRSGRDVRVV